MTLFLMVGGTLDGTTSESDPITNAPVPDGYTSSATCVATVDDLPWPTYVDVALADALSSVSPETVDAAMQSAFRTWLAAR